MSHHLVQIEHLGIAVKDIEAGNALYTKLLGVPPYKEEVVESEGVRTSFFKAGPNKIELLQATSPDRYDGRSAGGQRSGNPGS